MLHPLFCSFLTNLDKSVYNIIVLKTSNLFFSKRNISPHLILIHILSQGPDRFHSIEVQYGELQLWLQQKVLFFDSMHQTRGQAPMDYKEYLQVLAEYKAKEEIHDRLRQLVEGNNQVGISPDAWRELDTNWQKVAAQVRNKKYESQQVEVFSPSILRINMREI